MSSAPVSSAKRVALQQRLARLGLAEADLLEKFILGSGRGGQKRNKTSSCVYLCHRPTGIEIKCGRARSRELNRFLARRELCDRLEERLLGQQSARRQAAARIRRQQCRRSRRRLARQLADKRHQALKKQSRRAPALEE